MKTVRLSKEPLRQQAGAEQVKAGVGIGDHAGSERDKRLVARRQRGGSQIQLRLEKGQ